MVTVSGSRRFILAAMLLASVCNTACTAMIPAGRQVEQAADSSGQVNTAQRNAMSADDKPSSLPLLHSQPDRGEHPRKVLAPVRAVPLPAQAYGAEGKKIPYVPQPNPYTTGAKPVPTEARAIYVVASNLLRQGNLKAARENLQKLTEKYPALSGAWVKLGAIEEKNENYDNAITHYAKAISVNSNNVNAYIALGLLQRRQGYFSDAQQTYLAALDVWRDFPEAHLNLAILYDLYANLPEEAQKHYEAYYFLTGSKDENVRKWMVEVKRRTGIERSFIDNPPKELAVLPEKETGDTDVAVAGEGS